jgi:hypothetical protein
LFFGECSGSWPDPLKACLEEAAKDVPEQTDVAFGTIAGLVADGAVVLAADAFIPPPVLRRWSAEPFWSELNAIVDPRFTVEPAAQSFGFRFVDTEVTLNGPSRNGILDSSLIQDDGWHLTAAGQQLLAEAVAAADGLGE